MIEILGILVSLDLFKVMFCCDLSKCHGACCVEGDAGAPVNIDEVAELEEAYEVVKDELPHAAQEIIENEGVVYPDRDGELVTQIINGKDCVFVKYDNISLDGGKTRGPRCALCAIDGAFRQGKFHWQKPISCALYPVRLVKIGDTVGVNVHKWDVCEPARQLGKKMQIPVYRFLKEPLIQRFGKEWYDEVCIAAEELKKAGYLD